MSYDLRYDNRVIPSPFSSYFVKQDGLKPLKAEQGIPFESGSSSDAGRV